jgi:glycosyltransferase involved in cell wall biosynthesis
VRILHVTDCYLPDLGGIEMHVSDLATRQAAAGHQVTVMTNTPASRPDSAGPVAIERLGCGFLALAAGYDVRRYVERAGVDLVHAHLSVASPLAWVALRASRRHPIVATVHSVLPDTPDVLRAAMAVTRFPSRSVTFTAVSEVAAAPWRRAMGDRMPVRLLPNGIDPGAWAGPHVGTDDGTFTVVSVGRFARRKRLRALVRVLAGVRRELPPGIRLRAALVGDGPQLSVVRDDVSRLGLDDVVQLTGALTREQIKQVLHRADVYVAPATLESFGIAALEARCAGVPVVAMEQGGAGEFVQDGREGFLVAGDQQMRDAILRLAVDPALRVRMREHNATTAPPMTWPAVLSLHDRVYERALTRSARSRTTRSLDSVAANR